MADAWTPRSAGGLAKQQVSDRGRHHVGPIPLTPLQTVAAFFSDIPLAARFQADQMPAKFTLAQVAAHNKPDDLWLVLFGKVYDVTKFYDEHPGGGDMLLGSTGAS